MMLCCTVGLYSQTTATYDNVRARQQLTLNGKTLTSILEVIDSASTNAQGATAKAVWDLVVAKYATITAGTGIDVTGTSPNYTISLDTLKRLYFRTDSTYTGGVGVVRWNNVDGTLEFGLAGGVVTLSIGQESVQHVKHADNTGLENGKVVYLTGSTGDNITVRYARANSEATSAGTFGVMTETVTGGEKGYCTTFGLVRGINTSNLTEGKMVWLSKDTAGAMTAVRPTAPNHGVEVGFCVKKAIDGVMYVTINNGYELEELHNVHVPSPTNNQALVYKSGNSRWEAMTIDTSSTNEGKLQGFKPSNNLYYDINTNTSGGTPITLYRGTGIGFDGTGGSPDGGSLTINNTGDLSEFNEGTLGVGAGSSTTSVISSNTSGANGVTITAGNGMAISETTSSNGGTITLTARDSLATNEGTLGVGAGSSTTSVITSNTSGASGVTITAGGGISVSETTSSNGGNITLTATDGSVSNEGKLSTRLDTGADVWIRSNTTPSDDIGIVAGTGVTISGTNSSSGGQIVVSSPAQTIDTFSVSGSTLSLSLSGDSQPAKTVTLPSLLSGVTGYISQFNTSTTIDTTGLFWANGSRLGVATANPTSTLAVRSSQDGPVIGTTELSSGYAGTNWTGSNLTWTHTTGSTAALTATVTNNTTGGYRVIMTITGRTAGTVVVSLKGDPVTSTISATSTLYFNYFTTAGLTVTPTSDFDGTIVFNVVSVTPATPVITTENSSGFVNYEQRVNSNGAVFMQGLNAGQMNIGATSVGIGYTAGRRNISGDNWTAIGPYAGQANKTGSSWIAIGAQSAQANLTGSSWISIGSAAAFSNTTGLNWTAIGANAGYSSTTGGSWTAIGASAGRTATTSTSWVAIGANSCFNCTGGDWVAIGTDAARSNLTGLNFVAIGNEAARYQSDGSSAAQYFQTSVYIGGGTRATNGTAGTLTSNEIAIGYLAVGLGTNKTVIGNTSTTQTHLYGNLTAGSNTTASARLDVRSAGNTSATDIANLENSDGDDILRIRSDGKNTYWSTNTATGTTGAQTINRPSGTVNFAAGATSLVVTNSLCTTSSIVLPVVRTNDATAVVKNIVPGAGSFTINLEAAATAETSVGFFIIN
jgi:hypothetical protein